ncbi:MAG: ornithine cyclodeaminase family protein [Chloroflexi bacterium]|nr:ornithine cyclodeaminase family protein [Ardenticatenaceae bacterium]MBL1130471.1 ornithine cyclodeaminase family protein [Chloroflexota bacterium]NOG36561.1 ornithine cyclodeaminase family protein [Chloroflexota bacterium]GIK57782.1 MAG: ornithine cyclodeaminase [Chloroflexota bacterium]
MKLRILTAAEVKQALPMAAAIAGMKSAYAQLSAGLAVAPLRTHLDITAHQGTTLVMPAFLPQDGALAVKVVSVFSQNAGRGERVINGLVLVIDAETGRPSALLEGSTLTAIRTGAGSGAATDLLARPDAHVVTILGSGVQARTQLEAVCTVRPVTQVRVYSPNQTRAALFAAEMAGVGPIPADVQVVVDAATAVRAADIICTATTSHTPVFDGRDLKPGAHINAIGSYQPTVQEIDAATVQRALVVVDSREATLAETGDLIIPRQQGLITAAHIYAELGEIVAGVKDGRTHPQQITLFKSVGTAVQDAIAGRIALANAAQMGLGTLLDL